MFQIGRDPEDWTLSTTERSAIGPRLSSDKVFDVIGRLLENISLRDYMTAALTGDEEQRPAGTRTRRQQICRERPRREAGEGLRGGGGGRPSPSRNATRAGPRTLPAPAPRVRSPLRRICRDQTRHRYPGRSGRSVLPRARPTGRPRPASARSGGVSVRGAKKATCSPPSRRGAVHLAAPRRTGLRRPVLPRHRSLFPPRPPRSHLHRSTCRRGRVMASRGGVRRRTNIG